MTFLNSKPYHTCSTHICVRLCLILMIFPASSLCKCKLDMAALLLIMKKIVGSSASDDKRNESSFQLTFSDKVELNVYRHSNS